MSIKLQVISTGMGACALSGKADKDGLTVAFDNEAPCFISWAAFKQLLSYKTGQTAKPEAKPLHPIVAPAALPAK